MNNYMLAWIESRLITVRHLNNEMLKKTSFEDERFSELTIISEVLNEIFEKVKEHGNT